MMISRAKHRSSVDVCADCGASDPSWASINRGLLLCAECCSVHRSLGRHISHVKSLRQGSWPPSLLAMVQALTAQNVNSIWEHSLMDTSAPKHLRKKPQPKDPLHPVKSEFILAKHLRLAYVLRARRDEPPAELARALHGAVRSASLDTAMRLLAQGADPNYFHPEKGSSCLHAACRAGQAAQAELLAAWGADPAARDRAGATPAAAASQAGHVELAARMTELVYEAPDRLTQFLTGSRPEHAAGHHVLPPPAAPPHLTDGAKAARGKLQLLPNHLFEELVMDIYDEVDRRETEAIWQTSGTGLERCGVVFLPVNPALSAPRNQGRQKLARLSATELAALLRDVLADAARRQHLATLQPRALPGAALRLRSQVSDDEPLYDSVASDDDYAPVLLDMSSLTETQVGETISSTHPAPLTADPGLPAPANNTQLETLQKELDSRDSTITELKNQLKNLQCIVEQLTKENSVLKTTSSVDDDSMTSQASMNESLSSNVLDEKPPERGRSLESESLSVRAEGAAAPARGVQRPVSMFEAREGPRSWQVTKHQLTTLSDFERSPSPSLGLTTPLGLAPPPSQAPPPELVLRRAEGVTRGIQELWAAAQERDAVRDAGRDAARERDAVRDRADDIRHAVHSLLALFPQSCSDRELQLVLSSLASAGEALARACGAGGGAGGAGGVVNVRAAAYDLAKATKLLVTRFQPA